MSVKKELKKAYLKLTGQYKKLPKMPKTISHLPYEVFVTNVITEEDLQKNQQFIVEMRKHHYAEPPKSILCFLPYGVDSAFLAGGFRTIMAINDALCRIFEAKIYLCFFPITEGEEYNKNFAADTAKHFPDLNYEIVSYAKVFDLHVDIAMCNFWLGAYPLVKFNNCREKYNLVQDHEANFYESGIVSTLAERTLSFGFYKIANSMALKNYLEYVDPQAAAYRYLPGIDHNIYYPQKNKNFEKETYKIIFYGRPSICRNCFSLLVPVLKNLKVLMKDKVEIISVGENYDVKNWGLEGVLTNYGKLNSLSELGELYRQCDIGISLISTPTFSYQHLEYMASGLCLVTNFQSGVNDILKDKENAVVCEPVVDILTARLVDLINHPQMMQKISENGIKFSRRLDWDACFKGIADFIVSDKRSCNE